MIHKDKKAFSEMIYRTAKQTGFTAYLLEKDYYLTIILSEINNLSNKLVFKGGTCLNKIYYSYYRLSEDLDFSMILPEYTVNRNQRRKIIKPIKEKIKNFADQFDMNIENIETAGRNESKQYIFNFEYNSIFLPGQMNIKLEIGLRFSPLCETITKPIIHKFLHPFTNEPLFKTGNVKCLSLLEIVSEKLRAAILRKDIASRDFYDIDFIIRNGFDFSNSELQKILIKKIKEDKGNTDLSKYKINFGRTSEEINKMKSQVETELLDVLTVNEKQNFNIDDALFRINKEMEKLLK